MQKGDIIRVSIIRQLGIGPDHFGIYDGNGGVYHFQGFNLETAMIKYTSLSEFENGGTSSICTYYTKAFENDVIIQRAQSMLNTNFGGYNLITNNCEHFATWCATGEKVCMQTSLINKAELDENKSMDEYKKYQNQKYGDIASNLGDILTKIESNEDIKKEIGLKLNEAVKSGLFDNLFKR